MPWIARWGERSHRLKTGSIGNPSFSGTVMSHRSLTKSTSVSEMAGGGVHLHTRQDRKRWVA